MATILYLPSSGASEVSSAGVDPFGGWLHDNGVSRPLNIVRANTALATLTYTPDAVDHLVFGYAKIAQFISPVLPPQTISKDCHVIFGSRANEALASNNLSIAWALGYLQKDGTPLGSVAGWDDGVEMATSLTGFVHDTSNGFDDQVIGEDFRLIFEVAAQGTPAAASGTQGHNFSMVFGDPMATGAQNWPQAADTTAGIPFLILTRDLLTY